jgi:hypothetical protein
MVSAIPSASVPDTSTSASEDRGVAELHRYAEWPQGTHAVIAVALLAALRLFASHDHSCAKTDAKPCIPSPSVTIVRKMLESCDNRAGSAKRHGNVFPRHAEWPHVADAVIEALFSLSTGKPHICSTMPMIRLLKQMLLRVTLSWISGEYGGEGSV